MNLMALIEEIDELEEMLSTTADYYKRTLLISSISAKWKLLHKLQSNKESHE